MRAEENISSEAILVFKDYNLYRFVLAYLAPLICAHFSHDVFLQDSDSIPSLDLVLLWLRLKANTVDKLGLSILPWMTTFKKTRL